MATWQKDCLSLSCSYKHLGKSNYPWYWCMNFTQDCRDISLKWQRRSIFPLLFSFLLSSSRMQQMWWPEPQQPSSTLRRQKGRPVVWMKESCTHEDVLELLSQLLPLVFFFFETESHFTLRWPGTDWAQTQGRPASVSWDYRCESLWMATLAYTAVSIYFGSLHHMQLNILLRFAYGWKPCL